MLRLNFDDTILPYISYSYELAKASSNKPVESDKTETKVDQVGSCTYSPAIKALAVAASSTCAGQTDGGGAKADSSTKTSSADSAQAKGGKDLENGEAAPTEEADKKA